MPQEQQSPTNPSDLEYFIICGLGSLGQNCVVSLIEFGVKIVAIKQRVEIEWEIESFPWWII